MKKWSTNFYSSMASVCLFSCWSSCRDVVSNSEKPVNETEDSSYGQNPMMWNPTTSPRSWVCHRPYDQQGECNCQYDPEKHTEKGSLVILKRIHTLFCLCSVWAYQENIREATASCLLAEDFSRSCLDTTQRHPPRKLAVTWANTKRIHAAKP